MGDRLAELESRLAAVEQRLDRIEGRTPEASAAEDFGVAPALADGFLSRASTLVGRVLLIFGGAYLLRAITDFNVVPTAFGISLGAAYALLWLYMAYRKGVEDDQYGSALFYGGASVLLALPLLVEACGRFALLSGRQGIFALAVFSGLTLAVAALRNLRILGWMIAAGSIIAAFAVLQISHAAVAASAFLVIFGVASLWTCYLRQWKGQQWLAALGANAGVLALILLSGSEQWTIAPLSAFAMGASLLVAYLASFAAWSHVRGQAVGMFEVVQALLAIVVAFVAAAAAARAGRIALSPVGSLGLVLSACAYGLAFTPETRETRGRNFFFYSSLGLLLLVVGSALVLSPAIAAAVWSLLALAMAFASGHYGRVALSLQCTFLLVAAGISSGILDTGWNALAGGTPEVWPALLPWHVIVALTTVACLFIPVAQHSDRWGAAAGLPQLIVLALSVWEVGGLIVVIAAPIIAGVTTADPNLAVLAALRTAVLAAASVTLALSSRHRRWPEARWLVYPVLALVGIKLFLEDFPNGQPVTLFVALALVGSALMLVARLLSRDAPRA